MWSYFAPLLECFECGVYGVNLRFDCFELVANLGDYLVQGWFLSCFNCLPVIAIGDDSQAVYGAFWGVFRGHFVGHPVKVARFRMNRAVGLYIRHRVKSSVVPFDDLARVRV